MCQASGTGGRQELVSVMGRIPWAMKFDKELVNSSAAKGAFERLIAAGCDPVDLLSCLDFACRDYTTTHARGERMLAQDLKVLAKQLLNNAKKLRKFEASEEKRAIPRPFLIEFQGLSGALQAYAECLMNEAKDLQKRPSGREAPGMAIGWLAARIRGMTDRTHYSEIARLMEAHYSMQGLNKDVSGEAIKKQVKRFRQKHPLTYSHVKNMASRQYGRYKDVSFLEKFPGFPNLKISKT